MNLESYLLQQNPVRGNKVVLNIFEFKNHGTIKSGSDELTSITVNEYEGFNYILKNGSGWLYATDTDGNPRKPSCFYIEDLNPLHASEEGETEKVYKGYDYFISKLPEGAKEIFDRMTEASLNGLDYLQLANFLTEINAQGFTFEYYLDAEPYNFRELTNDEKTLIKLTCTQ